MLEGVGKPAFSAFGVEIEYALVKDGTLDVWPASEVLFDASGYLERGPYAWSNELVRHVVEIKCDPPSPSLAGLAEGFQAEVREINRRLAPGGGRLLPGGMHPWMDPARETQLWPGEGGSIYATFDRLFDCRRHGWANLQSTHMNLPFADDAEFARLHAAVRVLLPLLPALAASSPFLDGEASGLLDTRLDIYRTNGQKVPSLTGRVIPERIFSEREYLRLLKSLYRDMAALDPEGVLCHEWVNARGAIPRFNRGTIEIRVLDTQECPRADLAVAWLIVETLKALVAERWTSLAEQQAWDIEPLHTLLLETLRTGDETLLLDAAYRRLFGWNKRSACRAGTLWAHLAAALPPPSEPGVRAALDHLLAQGPLARRLRRALPGKPSRDALREVYGRLADCLADGALFEAS